MPYTMLGEELHRFSEGLWERVNLRLGQKGEGVSFR